MVNDSGMLMKTALRTCRFISFFVITIRRKPRAESNASTPLLSTNLHGLIARIIEFYV